MALHITHPEVRKVIARCEQEVRELTGNPAISISFIDSEYAIEFDQIVNEVSKVTKVSVEDLISKCRKIEYVQARQLIVYYVRKHTRMSYKEIGRRLGDRDHTTVISSIERINALVESGDYRICDLVKKVNRRLRELVEDRD